MNLLKSVVFWSILWNFRAEASACMQEIPDASLLQVQASHSPHLSSSGTMKARPATAIANRSDCFTNWGGMNSFFLWAMTEETRSTMLTAMKNIGVKVVRVWVTGVEAGYKGSDSAPVSDLEPICENLGDYQFEVLDRINVLMKEVVTYGMKLSLVLHDRYALGCFSNDAYQKYLGLNSVAPYCSQENDASEFYRNVSAIAFFDKRIETILKYKNPYLDNKTWGELSKAIAMVAPQNEAQGLDSTFFKEWTCGRAKTMRQFLDPGIMIATGGGRTFEESSWAEHFKCPEIDVVSLHDYQNVDWDYIWQGVQKAKQLARPSQQEYGSLPSNGLLLPGHPNGKRVLLEEYGSNNYENRASVMQAYSAAAFQQGVPFMPWEYVKPGNTDGGDYEFDEGMPSWQKISEAVNAIDMWGAAFHWPNVL